MNVFNSQFDHYLNGLTFKAVVLMAGESTRLAGSTPKQFLPLGDKQVYQWSLETLIELQVFREIVLVVPTAYQAKVQREVKPYSLHAQISIVEGGTTRQASSFCGVKACGDDTDFVLIHDSARPFVSVDIILRNIKAVLQSGACNTCLPVKDTIVQVKERAMHIPDRRQMWIGQTPQSFRYEWIKQAHEEAVQRKTIASDDCKLLIDTGKECSLVYGHEDNHKITTPWDWQVMQIMAEKRSLFAKQ
jgi:2-C-methyl-D-erythritol 4-phosphate cytidylyltransferase